MSNEARRVRVATTLPTGIDFERTPSGKSFAKLKSSKEYLFHSVVAQGGEVAINRNQCVTEKTTVYIGECDFDVIVFVDCDVEYSQQNMIDLLNTEGPIVFGAQPMRDTDYLLHAGYWGDVPGTRGKDLTVEDAGIVEVQRVGGGFLKIEKSVFENCFVDGKTFISMSEARKYCQKENLDPRAIAFLKYPYFTHSVIEHEIAGENHASVVTEDWYFCMRVSGLGYKILCNCDVMVKHLDGPYPKDPEEKPDCIEFPTSILININPGLLAEAFAEIRSQKLPVLKMLDISDVIEEINTHFEKFSKMKSEILKSCGATSKGNVLSISPNDPGWKDYLKAIEYISGTKKVKLPIKEKIALPATMNGRELTGSVDCWNFVLKHFITIQREEPMAVKKAE